MQRILLRLDDASEYMDIDKWNHMKRILDKYNVKPLFGIIPANEDPNLLRYGKVERFWDIVHSWIDEGWTPALHGYTHVFETNQGGINPVNRKSEFAGVPYDRQLLKIKEGVAILRSHGVDTKVFFAPAHTFDENTLRALKAGSDIRIISDTPTSHVYSRDGFTFVPQQSGRVRRLPFKTVTYCYHPNTLSELGFTELVDFLQRHRVDDFPSEEIEKKMSAYDMIVMKLYHLKYKFKH